MNKFQEFVSAILAGIEIGFGALFMLAARSQGYSPIVGGLCFSCGLYMVITTQARLFTGLCARSYCLIDGGKGASDWFRSLIMAFFGNLFGAIFLILLVKGCGIEFSALPAVAGPKLETSWLAIFCKGFACNMLVCLAVIMSNVYEFRCDPAWAVLATVPIFVACGFEHSIANMTILGLYTGLNSAVVVNILISAFGNFLGGSIIGVATYYAKRVTF